jgi:branched-chain amino acid aminotransferase
MSNSLREVAWVDGQFVGVTDPVVAAGEAGLTVGLGVFDTLCGLNGDVLDLSRHHQRLVRDAEKCGLSAPELGEVDEVLRQLMEKNGFVEGRCRLRVTLSDKAGATRCMMTAVDFPERARYARLVLSDSQVNPYSVLSGVKSTSYAQYVLALREAQEKGGDEALLLNVHGHVCEGATSNVFIVMNGEVYTPPLSSGCLPGIVRENVLEICSELGIIYHMRDLVIEDVQQSDEVFVTNSLRGVQAVESVDGVACSGVEGVLVQAIQQAYRDRVWG